ncbi:hypothetical protein HanPI659440_Chr00c05g0714231 [Helianthus annuus]|nr:hypothetical protein HanPI659440_Chr00c05g0714231 [Helianthus annuus]
MCSRLSPPSVPATRGLDSARFCRLERLFRLRLSALWQSAAPFAVAPTSRLDLWWFGGGGGGGGWLKSGGGDRNVSVEIESGSGGNMGASEKRKAGSGIRHAFDKVCFEY